MSAATRKANKRFRDDCQSAIDESAIPAPIAKTLAVIIGRMGSATDYTLSWVSQDTIAELTGQHPTNIKKHIRRIKKTGLLVVEPLGGSEARAKLARFNGRIADSLRYTHRLNFYSINRAHGFWAGDQEATQGVLGILAEESEKEGKRRVERERRRVVKGSGDAS